ncbi:spore germination protein KB [Paenibacillus endophyticus]|uniref:Spore germination protein KB n=1 Tax=Paenibacillus endophyticus TaxID=1294268 RepID=A0A7W5CDW6_9BACL|nr:endospore germination permease [Paenibacillus endophyticus]MBB3155896.1 spore germination protein KB [Paenibacillus endophyticus]
MNKINQFQFMLLISLFTVGNSILLLPELLYRTAYHDSWLAIIIGIGASLLINMLLLKLSQFYPDLTWVEISEKLLGKWFGGLVSVFMLFYLLYGVTVLLFLSGQFINIEIMPETPLVAFSITMAVIMVFGVRLGLVTLGRAAEIFFMLVTLLFILLLALLVPQMELTNIKPVLETPIKNIIHASFVYFSISGGPLVCFLMILPNTLRPNFKSFQLGSLIGGLFIFLTTLTCILVLGPNMQFETYPSYSIAKKVNVEDFITRIELIFAVIWFVTIYYKLALYFYATIKGFSDLFKLSKFTSISLPIAIIAVVLSTVIFPDTAYESMWLLTIYPFYSFTAGVILPILLLCAHFIKAVVSKLMVKESR